MINFAQYQHITKSGCFASCNMLVTFSCIWILDDQDATSCLCCKPVPEDPTEIKFSNTYAVEFLNNGLIRRPKLFNRGRHVQSGDSEVCSKSIFLPFLLLSLSVISHFTGCFFLLLANADVPICSAWCPYI